MFPRQFNPQPVPVRLYLLPCLLAAALLPHHHPPSYNDFNVSRFCLFPPRSSLRHPLTPLGASSLVTPSPHVHRPQTTSPCRPTSAIAPSQRCRRRSQPTTTRSTKKPSTYTCPPWSSGSRRSSGRRTRPSKSPCRRRWRRTSTAQKSSSNSSPPRTRTQTAAERPSWALTAAQLARGSRRLVRTTIARSCATRCPVLFSRRGPTCGGRISLVSRVRRRR